MSAPARARRPRRTGDPGDRSSGGGGGAGSAAARESAAGTAHVLARAGPAPGLAVQRLEAAGDGEGGGRTEVTAPQPVGFPVGAAGGTGSPAGGGGGAGPARPLDRAGPTPSLPAGIRTKLVVGAPGDAYEQEADAVASRVAQGRPAPVAGISRLGAHGLGEARRMGLDEEEEPVQAQLQDEEEPVQTQLQDEEEPVQTQPEDEEEPVQAREAGGGAGAAVSGASPAGTAPPAPGTASRAASVVRQPGSGRPLPAPTRSTLEASMGADLGAVRVHTGPRAEDASSELRARAFTHGSHIWLGRGESPSDLPLMAHEVTHVVQQDGVVRRQPLDRDEEEPRTVGEGAGSQRPAGRGGAGRGTPRNRSVAGGAPTRPTQAPGRRATGGTTRAGPAQDGAGPEPRGASRTQEPGAQAGAGGAAGGGTTDGQAATAAGPGGGGTQSAGPEPLMPPPPEGLREEERARIEAVDARAGAAVAATTELPGAGEQVGEARGAVEEPEEETQARAQDELVEALGQRPEPSPEIEELCDRIRTVIREKRPPDEESLVEAEPEEMAEEAGRDLNESVEGDAERVQGEYAELEGEPEGTPTRRPQAMASPPGPAETPTVAGERATPDGVTPEDVSLDADVEASEERLEEAGMNTEPARLVESGPVAEARQAQGELAETAAREPQAVLAEQQVTLAGARADMAALTASALGALQGERRETATGGRAQQEAMVGSEEAMRAQAAAEAERIFEDAQTRVATLLDPLPRTAMETWEAGIRVLSTRFEQHLARVQRWIDERHESTALAVIDYLAGLPDWVTEEYDEAEEAFGDGVCELIREISTEVNGVILACEAIIDEARADIDQVFEALPAELQEWATAQQERFGERLDGLQERARQTREDFTRELTQRASEAVQSVRERVHELREAARGLLGRIADAVDAFLEDPARFILEGLLQLVGIAPSAFWAVVDRIGQVLEDIAEDPMGFGNNLMSALGQGFQQFFDNITDHLLQGLLDWLFSGLGAVGVQLPSDTSLRSVITFFLQLMGLTWENIREILARHVGEENVALLEKAWELVSAFMEMGPEGLFELIKEQLDPANLLDIVLEAAVEYLVQAVVQAVTARIIALFNPVGAIVQAIEAIYRVLKWIFENAARIFRLVETVVNGVADLIAGNIGAMANAVEGALAGLIAPVIDFLAGYLGLGGLPDKIADVIRGLQRRVLAVVERVIAFLADRARGLLRALGLGEDAEDEVDEEDPEKADRVRAGLAAIDAEEQRRAEGGKISREEAEQVAGTVREAHPVFTRLAVVDGGDSWNYRWEASPGGEKDTETTKEEGSAASVFAGRRIDESGIEGELVAAGYRRPYQRQGRWIIARVDASSGLPRLSVSDGIISQGPTEDQRDRGEVAVELGAILASLPAHPHLHLFSIDPTAGQLRLGNSLRKEALSAYRPRRTRQMRRAIDQLAMTSDETEGLVEIPVGGSAELAEIESTGELPSRITGSGLRASAMSESLVEWFVDLRRSGWPPGWEVHHVVPTDWGGSDNVSNYAAIPGAMHADITSWWNRLRTMILRSSEAAAAREDGTTAEYRSVRLE